MSELHTDFLKTKIFILLSFKKVEFKKFMRKQNEKRNCILNDNNF